MPRNGRMTEAELAWGLRRCARAYGWREHVVYDSRRSPAGWPDLLFARDDRLVVWELKSDRGRVTPEQADWLDWWARFAASVTPRIHVAMIRPDDYDAALQVLMDEYETDAHPWPARWAPRTSGEAT